MKELIYSVLNMVKHPLKILCCKIFNACLTILWTLESLELKT